MQESYSLPSVTGHEGLYQFEYAPYFLGVANALDDPENYEIVLMKASQIGWTYFILGYILYRIQNDPCPMLGVFATEKDGTKFYRQKLVKTVESNPDFSELIDISKKSPWNEKHFPDGFLSLVGSNSPGNLKSMSSVGIAFVEEPDDTASDVQEQGDSIDLCEERLKRYPGVSKLIVGGTAKTKDLSKTEARLKQSYAAVLPIVCHSCGESHVLDWDNVSWEGKDESSSKFDEETGELLDNHDDVFGFNKPSTATYICPYCKTEWDDNQRKKNVRKTVFDAYAGGDPLAGWVKTQDVTGVAGFQKLSELYVCVPGTSLEQVVREYLVAMKFFEAGDDTKLKKFKNQKLGLSYEYESDDRIDPDQLRSWADDYEHMVCPGSALKVTAGVDVQKDRLAIVIRAWGRKEESWLLYWGELVGRPGDENDLVWDELDKLLFEPIKHERFGSIFLDAVSIDSSDGNTSDEVYQWVRTRSKKHRKIEIMAIKGSSHDDGSKNVFSHGAKKDHNNTKRVTKADKHGVIVYSVGTHRAKDIITKRLKGTSAVMHAYKTALPSYFEQVVAEFKAPSGKHRGKLLWHCPSGKRNEALDCEVYALHAARAINIHRISARKWDLLEQTLAQNDLFSVEGEEQDEIEEHKTNKSPKRSRRRSGFVTRVRH